MGEKLDIPAAVISRLAKRAEPEIRVGADAIVALNTRIVEFVDKLVKDAAKLAKHAGRKTIKEDDVTTAE